MYCKTATFVKITCVLITVDCTLAEYYETLTDNKLDSAFSQKLRIKVLECVHSCTCDVTPYRFCNLEKYQNLVSNSTVVLFKYRDCPKS